MHNKIKILAKKHYPEIQKIRHKIHQNPELGFEEYETSKLIQSKLNELGIENHVLCETGVVGIIKGEKPGKTVLLRADMDALPVLEEADVTYKSLVPNRMHACGHDGHTASLLGAAMILNELKSSFSGNVKLMFQPAEETVGGALPMIENGVLENPKVDACFGLHLWGPIEENKVTTKKGSMMASPDSFNIKIIGRGGHASSPEQTIDPINIANQIISSMQTIISRRIDPLESVVISFCSYHSGTATNIIPEYALLKGTFRTLKSNIRELVPKLMDSVLKGICASYGASYEFELLPGYPPLINDAKMTNLAFNSISKIIGSDNIFELENPNMGGEDFAFLCEKVPSCFYFYGIHDLNKDEPIHHHPKFSFNDEVLEKTSATLANIAIDFLGEQNV